MTDPQKQSGDFQQPQLTAPQHALLEEIRESGVLYVRRHGRYGRTVASLVRKGFVVISEPDYSRLEQDGYSVAEHIGSSERVDR